MGASLTTVDLLQAIGAILSPIIAVLVGWYGVHRGAKASAEAAAKALENAVKADRRERREARGEARLLALADVVNEVDHALFMSDKTRVSHAHMRLPTEAFDNFRPWVLTLRDDVRASFFSARAAIKRYNTLAAYANDKVGLASGLLNDPLARELKGAVEAIETLRTVLGPYVVSQRSSP